MSLAISRQFNAKPAHEVRRQEGCSPTAFADTVGQAYVAEKSAIHRKDHGLYLTPPPVAAFMAAMITPRPKIRLLDPAAGAGILLCAAVEALVKSPQPPGKIDIVAYEIDPELAWHLRQVLDNLTVWAKTKVVKVKVDIRCCDFILSEAKFLNSGLHAYDAVIINPPYFKVGKNDPRAVAARSVVHGQPNIYGLFMAVSAALLVPGGDFVSITPRSFASGPYFRKFREEFFAMMRPIRTHVFGSRKDAFSRDEVLQENVILHGIHHVGWHEGKNKHCMTVSSSAGLSDLGTAHAFEIYLSHALDAANLATPFRLPVSRDDTAILDAIDGWGGNLKAYGMEISTGPVVPFRATEFLSEKANGVTVPLIWMNHVRTMDVHWPSGVKKPQWIEHRPKSIRLLVTNNNYVILRRFSAKEEHKRLTAVPLLAGQLAGDMIGLENHLNYIHRPGGRLEEVETLGLAALYNSALMDGYFRCVNGNTQVSATELRAMPLPPLIEIKALGRHLQSEPHNIGMIDELVKELAAGSSITNKREAWIRKFYRSTIGVESTGLALDPTKPHSRTHVAGLGGIGAR
ncbi:MAG: N-6 DNA methylase [Hyphomicrobiales bacterium]|nr:N-6 DNA methylase [Hyphomicrobiales bacterium]